MQVCAAIAAWVYVVLLHWRNDGLWYLGDSSVHAANGAFWWDFLTRLPHDPLQFALSYYARYPVINPTAYPPVFYLMEGFLYRIFGISPYVPRAMVLICVLCGALYLMAWIRRWICEEAGWIGALFVLQPATVVWGNAIMLNVPATVVAIAALYHNRRWLEGSQPRHLYAAALFGVLAVLTYMPSAVVVPIMLAMVLLAKKARALLTARTLIVAAMALMALLPWAAITLRWAPGHRQANLLMGSHPFWKLASWWYYPQILPQLVTVIVLVLAVVALIDGLIEKRWRAELRVTLTWLVVCYVWYSLISVKEGRYALLLAPGLILLAAIGAAAVIEVLRSKLPNLRTAPALALALTVLVHVPLAHAVQVRRIDGVRDVVRFVRRIAPGQWVFYGGEFNGIFAYYLRAEDQNFSQGMVRSSKLLYVTKIDKRFGLREIVKSPTEVLERLRHGCGCPYLVVEREAQAGIAAEQYLRQLLKSADFQLLRSFEVQAAPVRHLDVYRFLNPGEQLRTFEIAFPELGDGVTYIIKPIDQ